MSPTPLLLRADNFTPPRRTPWGGTRILGHYKRGLSLPTDKAAYPIVGESWEVSVEPDFPSYLEGTDTPLSAVLDAPCALLVKLLDAADDLSVQIHPPDDYPALSPDQSGKPESWYVLEGAPGAGLHLGLREGVTRTRMADALRRGEDLSNLLFFVPVEAGDFFLIEAGTPHSIGRGVTLVEPQRVQPGRRGVTYRYWDWNRRYDADGRPDPGGTPRMLHVDHALSATAWEAPRQGDMLARIRHRSGPPALDGPAALTHLCGTAGAPIPSPHLAVSRLTGTGRVRLARSENVRGLTVIAGEARLLGPGFDVRAPQGRSVALPAGTDGVEVALTSAHAILAEAPTAPSSTRRA